MTTSNSIPIYTNLTDVTQDRPFDRPSHPALSTALEAKPNGACAAQNGAVVRMASSHASTQPRLVSQIAVEGPGMSRKSGTVAQDTAGALRPPIGAPLGLAGRS